MITNKDIRVEKGNIVLNGDKFPLDGQSPEAIMQIVEDNSDTTPTENSTAPITSGGVYTANKAITDTIGDITQTGVTGASVAAQIGTLNNAIGGLHYAVFSKPLTSVAVDTAWGNMYESSLINIDITSLGLTTAPMAVFLGVVDAGSSVIFELSSTTKDAINFRLTRPTSVTIPSVTVTALVIY